MALAQAQHVVRQLADTLERQGKRVRFAIHPVAGRMPGHMNVLLAEADIPYDKLFEMDQINDDFQHTDAVVVIGANDVLNPAAREAEGTPIYGMPVLNVDAAKHVIICNYDLNPGYAGVENPMPVSRILSITRRAAFGSSSAMRRRRCRTSWRGLCDPLWTICSSKD